LGIPEYWIVDPQTERITVLTLKGKRYRVLGEFAPGQKATSALLDGFRVDVSAVFEAGRQVS
jgi:Uma2 family endonuclease